MKYYVNDSCIGCGLCESICPEVFSLPDGVSVAMDGEVPASSLEAASQAMREGPVGSIEER